MITQIHATLDDVGNCKKDGICAVAGYVAYKEAWNKFNWRWMMSLQQLNMESLHTARYLHDFPLVGGKLDDEAICLILAPFIGAVRESLIEEGAYPVSVITECKAYDMLTDKEKKYIRPPEEHSFEVAVMLAAGAIRSSVAISDWVSVQMDESDNADMLYKRYRTLKVANAEYRDHLSSLCFCDDRRHPPVQAADMLANVLLKMWRGVNTDGPLPRCFQQLATMRDGTLPRTHIHFNEERLKRLAALRMQQKEKLALPQ
jgi:hypothetical protein